MRLLKEFVSMIQNEPDRRYLSGRSEKLTSDTKKEVLRVIDETRVIINDSILELDTRTESIRTDIAPPFETCWIQCPEGTSLNAVLHDDKVEQVYGIWIHETRPYYYLFGLVTGDPVEPEGALRLQVGYMDFANPAHTSNEIWYVLSAFLQPFGREYALGVEKTSARFKFKRDGEKILHKIKKIIHVVPKTKSAMSKLGDKVDWSHQWRVRGHWREIKGIGKDRAGEYCIKGWTWVSDFVKGPEDKPIVEKTRVVTK